MTGEKFGLEEKSGFALLTPVEMAEADRLAIAGGVPGIRLMENAGRAVADAVRMRWTKRPVAVLCGPGNNGGDGFVAARLLREAGWDVRLGLLGARGDLKGDAAYHAGLWAGDAEALMPALLDGAGLVIDAIFGAGLARDIEGAARLIIESVVRRGLPVVAIDVPSGIDGASGAVRGVAPRAELTVTFFRKKPGHLLYPGRKYCGETVLADIGIPAEVLERVRPRAFENAPGLWLEALPWPASEGHKYRRGHALIAGGAEMTGAARLAARAAQRIGAGLVTIAAPAAVFPIYATALASVIVRSMADSAAFAGLLADRRFNAVLVGPGGGVGEATRAEALAALASNRQVVLDADLFACFATDPAALFGAIRGPCLLTPHEGEFARVFARTGDKLASVREAAALSGAMVLLKGPDTVIAGPDGVAVINADAPPELATAGSGDVLAGLALGLLAQGMPLLQAAAGAVWIHGEAARLFGPGLVAEDLIDQVPAVLRRLKAPAAVCRL